MNSKENLINLNKKLKDAIMNPLLQNEVINILVKMSSLLKIQYNHSKEDCINLAGPGGSLIMVLEHKSCSNECYIEATKALHHLTFTQSDTLTQNKSDGSSVYPPEVTASVQRVVISIIKHQSLPISNFTQMEYLHLIISCLSILYNLVICAPEEVLGNAILNASHAFAFYKAPGIKEPEFQQNEIFNLNEEISTIETDSSCRVYTNRNRRKRLRRKRAQPLRSTLEMEPCTLSRSVPPRAAFVPPMSPSADSLDAISLKPEWIRGHRVMSLNHGHEKGESADHSTSIRGFAALRLSSHLPTEEDTLSSPPPPSADCTHSSLSPLAVTSSILALPENDHLFQDEEEKLVCFQAKVRTCALYTINAVIHKEGRQNKFGFWPKLMCQNPSLLTCILRDPSPSVRMVGLLVINTFLTGSRQVLSMAVDDEAVRGSYTTLGRQLGSSIRELHRCLALALLSERKPCLLVAILKTIELLVENVKYSNLRPGLLTKVVTHVKYFLRYKEAVVRANAFSVMVSFLMVKPQLPEIRDLLTKYRTPAPSFLVASPVVRPPSPCDEELPGEELKLPPSDPGSEESFSSDSCPDDGGDSIMMVSWIVQRCLDSLLSRKMETTERTYVQVQLQSLKVLSALVSEHLVLMRGALPLIQRAISACCTLKSLRDPSRESNLTPEEEPSLVSPDPDVVVEHAFLLLGALMASVKTHLENGHFRPSVTEALQEDEAEPVTSQMALMLWLWALQDPLRILMTMGDREWPGGDDRSSEGVNSEIDGTGCRDYPLKPLVSAANVLSYLYLSVLEAVGEPILNQILSVIRLLLGSSEMQLRLSGVRIMAIVAVYAPVRESVLGPLLALSTIDLTTQLLAHRHNSVNKDRLLSSWALANVFSAVPNYRETARGAGQDFLGKEEFMRVIRVAIAGCHDKDKIKPHAGRALGYAIAYLPSDMVSESEVTKEIELAIQTLLESCSLGSNMRMRWNACYALGNILSSPYLSLMKTAWKSPVLIQLVSLVKQFPNYKVRIQACVALCGIKQREVFGTDFPLVCRAFLKGLDDAQNIPDYQEIQHREEFITQLSVGLSQLVLLLQLEDLEDVVEDLVLRQDTAQALLTRTQKTIPPEQSSCFLKAVDRVRLLANSDALTAPQTRALAALRQIFGSIL